eukprot:TRINITY_DN11380_c0_g1_i1.p1 TRINITY_DN11380_c0_g1~~TRINITY_DN11380_c0_g1_i1.p1  ORF type:complete len:534 (-),score=80.11 TRINITY_DN11380_c0_g1_i1:253-1785(-)
MVPRPADDADEEEEALQVFMARTQLLSVLSAEDAARMLESQPIQMAVRLVRAMGEEERSGALAVMSREGRAALAEALPLGPRLAFGLVDMPEDDYGSDDDTERVFRPTNEATQASSQTTRSLPEEEVPVSSVPAGPSAFATETTTHGVTNPTEQPTSSAECDQASGNTCTSPTVPAVLPLDTLAEVNVAADEPVRPVADSAASLAASPAFVLPPPASLVPHPTESPPVLDIATNLNSDGGQTTLAIESAFAGASPEANVIARGDSEATAPRTPTDSTTAVSDDELVDVPLAHYATLAEAVSMLEALQPAEAAEFFIDMDEELRVNAQSQLSSHTRESLRAYLPFETAVACGLISDGGRESVPRMADEESVGQSSNATTSSNSSRWRSWAKDKAAGARNRVAGGAEATVVSAAAIARVAAPELSGRAHSAATSAAQSAAERARKAADAANSAAGVARHRLSQVAEKARNSDSTGRVAASAQSARTSVNAVAQVGMRSISSMMKKRNRGESV